MLRIALLARFLSLSSNPPSAVAMRVLPVKVNADNFAYIVFDDSTRSCTLVDAAEPAKILPHIPSSHTVTSILTTHHHLDHAGGNDDLHRTFPELPIFGGDDRILSVTNIVSDGTPFNVFSPESKIKVTPLFTPCHTKAHVCYHFHSEGDGPENSDHVFTGDTLFIAGCGRFFEGTPQQMHTALLGILNKLPAHTKVWCGHEYTKSNLRFAQVVEPGNKKVGEKLAWCETVEITVPSTIAEEREINPFFRLDSEEIIKATGEQQPIEIMGKLRELKNAFRG
ncbi:beta-lactamase-like protein [Cladochytrium replicatum]|nr:beta-lactamase-like protein [Cladochytrium replicatum]